MKVRSPGMYGRGGVSTKDAGRGQSVPSANVQNREQLPYYREKKMCKLENASF